jgi:hypothetical protein
MITIDADKEILFRVKNGTIKKAKGTDIYKIVPNKNESDFENLKDFINNLFKHDQRIF